MFTIYVVFVGVLFSHFVSASVDDTHRTKIAHTSDIDTKETTNDTIIHFSLIKHYKNRFVVYTFYSDILIRVRGTGGNSLKQKRKNDGKQTKSTQAKHSIHRI